MLFVGYFESLASERGIAWRCADSLFLRQFLKLGPGEAVPDQQLAPAVDRALGHTPRQASKNENSN